MEFSGYSTYERLKQCINKAKLVRRVSYEISYGRHCSYLPCKNWIKNLKGNNTCFLLFICISDKRVNITFFNSI